MLGDVIPGDPGESHAGRRKASWPEEGFQANLVFLENPEHITQCFLSFLEPLTDFKINSLMAYFAV